VNCLITSLHNDKKEKNSGRGRGQMKGFGGENKEANVRTPQKSKGQGALEAFRHSSKKGGSRGKHRGTRHQPLSKLMVHSGKTWHLSVNGCR